MKTEIKKKKIRDANLDLLRIVSMLLIVFLHSIDHSGVLEKAEVSSGAMYFYVRFTYALCQVCVNFFVMLSGYYLVKSKFRLQKLVVLWMETVFYTLIFKVIFMLTGQQPFSVVSLASSFFPILTGRYWFITIYVGLYLISPFLNIAINAMNKKQFTALNLLLGVLFSVWISIHPSIAGMNSGGGWGLPWFVVLYFAAAWFRLYYKPSGKSVGKILAFVAIPLVIAAAQSIVRAMGIGILETVVSKWFRYDSLPVYVMTLCLFAGFLNVSITGKIVSRVICGIAPLTLGVYLIHAHAEVSPWLWDTLNMPAKMGSVWFPVIQLGIVLLIFAVCIVIEKIRELTVGRLERIPVLQQICQKATDWFDKRLSVKEQ